jgi:hypothetical protein
MSMVTAEALIIAKLEWAKLGDSERQLRDVAEILAIQGEGLDQAYLEGWIVRLDLGGQWNKAQSRVMEDPNSA